MKSYPPKVINHFTEALQNQFAQTSCCATIAEAYAVNKKHFSFSMNFVSSYYIFFPFARKNPALAKRRQIGYNFFIIM
ncbi:MAG TPA: hypothetical protein DCL14_00175 [Ruminococcaceae bacterium]|nr:hypothetical protein [Oscillospiraceae bacterium]